MPIPQVFVGHATEIWGMSHQNALLATGGADGSALLWKLDESFESALATTLVWIHIVKVL